MKRKKWMIIIAAVVVLALLVAAATAITKKNIPSTPVEPGVSTEINPGRDTITETDVTEIETSPESDTQITAADPETLSSVAIEPLGVTVFYTKGTPGFEYEVLRTVDKTEYVQFTSSNLVGTKCTDDEGAFATILKNPSATERQTTSQEVTVNGDTYGLSLSSVGCTGDADLLAQYQDGFKNGFPNLAAL